MHMNKIKLEYEQPSCDLLVLTVEQEILYVSGGANYSTTPGGAGGDDVYYDGEGF